MGTERDRGGNLANPVEITDVADGAKVKSEQVFVVPKCGR